MDKKVTALVFPGQGSQVVGMGYELYNSFGAAKQVFDTVDEVLGIKLSKIIFEGPDSELVKTENTQPALMAVSLAVIAVLEKEFGKRVEDLTSLVAGHSLGEYSALCAARAFNLETAAKLLQIRGSAMARCANKHPGAMAAIIGVETKLGAEIAELAADGEICQLANDNSVGQIVISGHKNAIERALKIAKDKGAKRAIILPVSGAFHCALMKEAEQEMAEALAGVEINTPSLPLICNVTATLVTDPAQIKLLLVEQITKTVRWRETMLLMQQNNIGQLFEIGAGKVLSGLASRTCPEMKVLSVGDALSINQILA